MKKFLCMLFVVALMLSQTLVFASDAADIALENSHPMLNILILMAPFLVVGGLVISVVLLVSKKQKIKMAQNNMQTEKGIKWFVFFAKVRPWFALISGGSVFVKVFSSLDVYLQYWWMWINLMTVIASIVLNIFLFIKSNGDYSSFVKFVNVFLKLEILLVAVQVGVGVETSVISAVVSSMVVMLLGYLLWVPVNTKYFARRLPTYEEEPLVVDCKIEKRTDFVDGNGWGKEIQRLSIGELKRRCNDEYEWTEDYRALCYEELMKREKENA